MFKKYLGVLMSHGKRMFKGGIAGVMTVMSFFGFPIVSFAGPTGGTTGGGGGGSYTKPLDSLKTILITVLGAAGGAVLAYGIYSIAKSVKKQEQGGIEDAIGTLVMGGIMVGGATIIGLLV